MRPKRLAFLLILLVAVVQPARAQFLPGGRGDTRPPLPTWAGHVGAATLGAALLGGLGLALGEIDIMSPNDRENELGVRRERERTTVHGLALLGTMGGAVLGASVVGSSTGDPMPYVMSGLGAGIGAVMGYGAGALLSDAEAARGAGFFVGTVLGAASGAYLTRRHTAEHAGLRASVAPVVGRGGVAGMRLHVAF